MECCVPGCERPATFVVTPSKDIYASFGHCSEHLTASAMSAPHDGERSWCVEFIGHFSDCAVHNAPAAPAGPCSCGAFNLQTL